MRKQRSNSRFHSFDQSLLTELSQATYARDALNTVIPTPTLIALGFRMELKQDK
jgi:hypothetical protein